MRGLAVRFGETVGGSGGLSDWAFSVPGLDPCDVHHPITLWTRSGLDGPQSLCKRSEACVRLSWLRHSPVGYFLDETGCQAGMKVGLRT